MSQYIISDKHEQQSRYGLPYKDARTWYWAEIDDNHSIMDNVGHLRAITEMEALDRLRESFPEIGAIKWISKNKYEEITNNIVYVHD